MQNPNRILLNHNKITSTIWFRPIVDQEKRHVFISYIRENQNQINRLCRDLESHRVNVWLDRNTIEPGARWKDAIRKAIRPVSFFPPVI
jgi:hypothetical protein